VAAFVELRQEAVCPRKDGAGEVGDVVAKKALRGSLIPGSVCHHVKQAPSARDLLDSFPVDSCNRGWDSCFCGSFPRIPALGPAHVVACERVKCQPILISLSGQGRETIWQYVRDKSQANAHPERLDEQNVLADSRVLLHSCSNSNCLLSVRPLSAINLSEENKQQNRESCV
jgi:hypothetical protein